MLANFKTKVQTASETDLEQRMQRLPSLSLDLNPKSKK